MYIDLHLTLDEKYPAGALRYNSNQLRDEVLEPISQRVDWANKLTGKALQEFFAGLLKLPDGMNLSG
jgi:hypothetical protein